MSNRPPKNKFKRRCRKKKYSLRQAHKAVERLHRIQEKRVHVYFCDWCHSHHVGGVPGDLAETNQPVGNFPAGHQVIILQALDASSDPLFEVEQRGRKGSVHLSEITIFDQQFEV